MHFPLHIFSTTMLKSGGLQAGAVKCVHCAFVLQPLRCPVCVLRYRYVSTREAEIQVNILQNVTWRQLFLQGTTLGTDSFSFAQTLKKREHFQLFDFFLLVSFSISFFFLVYACY